MVCGKTPWVGILLEPYGLNGHHVSQFRAKLKVFQQPNLEQIGYLCRRVAQASLRDLQLAAPGLDVTIGQMGTLVLIACNPGITPTDICRAQGYEKPTITASIDALVRRQLVRREPSKSDRRSLSLYLTERGKSFYQEISPHVKEADRRLTRALSAAERDQLRKLLLRIYVQECADKELDVMPNVTKGTEGEYRRPRRYSADPTSAKAALRRSPRKITSPRAQAYARKATGQ